MQLHERPDPPGHAQHDPHLIAALAAGDLADTDRARARAQRDECTACALLHADLLALAVATRSLPNLAIAPRDYRLTADQAARLGRGSWLRRLLTPFGSARSATRPVAAAFTTLGLAGFLVAAALPGALGAFGGPASTGAERDHVVTSGSGPTAAPEAPAQPAPNQPGGALDGGSSQGEGNFGVKGGSPAASPDRAAVGGRPGAEQSGGDSGAPRDTAAPGDTAAELNLLLSASLALLAIGLVLFGLRFAARRIT